LGTHMRQAMHSLLGEVSAKDTHNIMGCIILLLNESVITRGELNGTRE